MRKLLNIAIQHTIFGKPSEVLYLTKVDMPSIQSNEILIQLKARPINPSDLLSIQGVGPYQKSVKLPAIPGFEGVGTVVEKGKDVLSPKVGDRIVSMKMPGSWQEFVALPAEEALPVPERISDNYAAQLCINPLTAWLIINKYDFKKGDIVVGNAANSTMGKLFAQFSAVFGYTFIGIVRRETHIEPLLKLGAGLVVHSEDKDYTTKISNFTQGKKPNIGVEAIGGNEGEKLIRILAPGSQISPVWNIVFNSFFPSDFHVYKRTENSVIPISFKRVDTFTNTQL